MDAQADQSLRWAHNHIVGFLVSRLIYVFNMNIIFAEYQLQYDIYDSVSLRLQCLNLRYNFEECMRTRKCFILTEWIIHIPFPFQVKIKRNIFEFMLLDNGQILENRVTLLTCQFRSYAEKLVIKVTYRCHPLLKCDKSVH